MKQLDYCKHKHNLLKNNVNDLHIYNRVDNRRKIPEYQECGFGTIFSTTLNEMYNNWYKDKKRVYREDLYKINGLGLAIWYMDDGSKCKDGGAILCTNCFDMEDLLLIQQMFKEKFNIIVNIYDKSNELYIPSKEFVKFRNLIEQYIEPSMAYKLGPSKTA